MPALPGFETADASLSSAGVGEMLDWPAVIGLGEVMDYRAMADSDARMLGVIAAARDKGRLIDVQSPKSKVQRRQNPDFGLWTLDFGRA